jgi:hypothetical protein
MPQFGDSRVPAVSAPVRSTASIVAIISAIASFYMSFHGRGIFAFFLALLAILAGLVGGVRALSPRIRGGILSILAVILGAIAIVFALIALVL